MIGIIGGTVFFKSDVFAKLQEFPENTKHGTVYLKKCDRFVFVPRHSLQHNIPAHKINYRANIKALQNLGIREVIGVYSCGSLKKELKPGTLLVPDDYINLFQPQTFYETLNRHVLPGLSEKIRKKIFKSAKKLGIPVKDGGTYFQTIGPRLETKAEVKMLKKFADVVGMTMASEATLCREAGLEFAAICSVDNFAHGITKAELSQESIEKTAAESSKIISAILADIIG